MTTHFKPHSLSSLHSGNSQSKHEQFPFMGMLALRCQSEQTAKVDDEWEKATCLCLYRTPVLSFLPLHIYKHEYWSLTGLQTHCTLEQQVGMSNLTIPRESQLALPSEHEWIVPTYTSWILRFCQQHLSIPLTTTKWQTLHLHVKELLTVMKQRTKARNLSSRVKAELYLKLNTTASVSIQSEKPNNIIVKHLAPSLLLNIF